jgi:hypothetical protein
MQTSGINSQANVARIMPLVHARFAALQRDVMGDAKNIRPQH